MRDINRLDSFYEELKELHKNYPDWRFGQFMLNFMDWYALKYKKDVFYLEEDRFLKYVKEYIEEISC